MKKAKRIMKIIIIVLIVFIVALLAICINHRIQLKKEAELKVPPKRHRYFVLRLPNRFNDIANLGRGSVHKNTDTVNFCGQYTDPEGRCD